MRNSDKLSRCLLLELTFRCRPVAFQCGLILQHRRLLEPSPSSSEVMLSSLRSSCLSFMFVCPFFFVPGIPMANPRSKIRHHIKDPCQIPRSEYSGVVLLCHSVAARRPGHSAPPSSAAGPIFRLHQTYSLTLDSSMESEPLFWGSFKILARASGCSLRPLRPLLLLYIAFDSDASTSPSMSALQQWRQ
ncbi:hypothetical protein C8J56DRAFT_980367 [Mycena floridula]|nr:hypothetical protein C8J56DRAFT_980367 [Mycena floridula]